MEYFQRHDQNFETRRVSAELREDGSLEIDLEEIEPPKDPDAEELEAEDRQAP